MSHFSHILKNKEADKNQATGQKSSTPQQQPNLVFKDNRPIAQMQQVQQTMVNNSLQVKQLQAIQNMADTNTFSKKSFTPSVKNYLATHEGASASPNFNPTSSLSIQRKINYASNSVRLPLPDDQRNKEGLIAALQAIYVRYGPAFADRIRVVVNHAEAHGNWTLGQILAALDAEARDAPIPITDVNTSNTGVRLPERESSQRDFAFTSHTRATATIGKNLFEKDSSDGTHAEEQLEVLLNALLDDGQITDVQEETLVITINNFPCLERCTPIMVRLKRRFPFMIINYANPFGSGGEFERAQAILRSAGITLVPFEPRQHMSEEVRAKLSADQISRFDELAKARTLHPRSTVISYHISGVLRDRFPDNLLQQVIMDVFSGTLREGDRFTVVQEDGTDFLFVYLGLKDGIIMIRPVLRGG